MPALLGFVAFFVYLGGAWKFWNGFHRTNFSNGRLQLTVFWPLFVLSNKSYRQNFNRALKG